MVYNICMKTILEGVWAIIVQIFFVFLFGVIVLVITNIGCVYREF